MHLDAEAGVLYVATANPAPDFPAELRGGANLYTNTLLALDARTGRLIWYDQMVPADDHDWDLTQASPLFTTRVDGVERKLIGTVGKDGVLRVVDRDSRERLYETPITTIENIEAEVTPEGTHACPGVLGGVEWNGPAFNPVTNLIYTPAVDWCGTFYTTENVRFVPGALYLGDGALGLDVRASDLEEVVLVAEPAILHVEAQSGGEPTERVDHAAGLRGDLGVDANDVLGVAQRRRSKFGHARDVPREHPFAIRGAEAQVVLHEMEGASNIKATLSIRCDAVTSGKREE